MAMEAGGAAIPATIQPVQRPREEPGVADGARRRGTATSPFAPQTNVNIKNSVANMAEILSKISSHQGDSLETLPPELQKLIDNIMKQAFSLDATLANGLGSTVESQRFSVDQLLTLSRILSQLGTLAEQGATSAMDPKLEAFLTGLKQLFQPSESQQLAPTLLHKLAFELLDAKSFSELPPELQYLFQPLVMGSGHTAPPPTESLGFLKQLLQYFLPSSPQDAPAASSGKAPAEAPPGQPAVGEPSTGAPAENTTEGARQTPQGTETARGETMPRAGAETLTSGGKERISETGKPPQGEATGKGAGESGARAANGAAERPAGEGAARTANNAAKRPTGDGNGRPLPSNTKAGPDGAQGGTATGKPSGAEVPENHGPLKEPLAQGAKEGTAAREPSGANRQSESMTGAKGQQLSSPGGGAENTGAPQTNAVAARTLLQNTPPMMDAMKQLASLLLKDAALTESDTKLLQNFINNQNGILAEKDAKQLQLLLRLCQSNIPASVQQAARQQNLPDLPKLWAFMQLCDLVPLKGKDNAAGLKKASKDVAAFASMMKGAMVPENSLTAEGNRVMSFMVPLYMGENEKIPFPAYIHVYDEAEEDAAAPGEKKKETWLRICLLTENIGAVDVTLRMYEKKNLDVRVLFSSRGMIDEFKEYIPEFQQSFADTSLTLKDLKVALAGELHE